METSLESGLLIVHTCFAIISLSLSFLLVFIVFRHTPDTFANFGMLIKWQAVIDLYVAIGSSACLQRIVPVEWAIILVSYGPCGRIGSSACYAAVAIWMGGQVCQIAILAARDDDGALHILMNTMRPQYEADRLVVTGSLDMRSICCLVYITILIVIIWPISGTILLLRAMILKQIEQQSGKLSEKTKKLHRKFMLSAQAAVPLVQLYGAFTFLLGFFNIVHDPVLEITTLLVSETTAFLSPSIVIFSIDHYRRAILSKLPVKNGTKISTVAPVSK